MASAESFKQEPLHSSYPVPVNQAEFEEDLIIDYGVAYPDSANLMLAAIEQIKTFEHISHTEDEYHPSGNFFSTVVLTMPGKYDTDDYAAPRDNRFETVNQGGIILGDQIPPESHALLEGIYRLTGAEIERDDHEFGLPDGEVIRKGEYFGKLIYFIEEYDEESIREGKQTLSLKLVDEKIAQESINALSPDELEDFIKISGIEDIYVLQAIDDHDINRANYKSIAHLFSQTRKIVDEAIIDDDIDRSI
jgi:hypothetical protein